MCNYHMSLTKYYLTDKHFTWDYSCNLTYSAKKNNGKGLILREVLV